MSISHQDEHGFSHIETVLVVVIVAAIGLIGWYVYQARQNTNKSYNAINSSSASPNFGTKKTVATGDTSNSGLQSSLQDATSAANQGNKDMAAANNGLNDQSTLTSVPQ